MRVGFIHAVQLDGERALSLGEIDWKIQVARPEGGRTGFAGDLPFSPGDGGIISQIPIRIAIDPEARDAGGGLRQEDCDSDGSFLGAEGNCPEQWLSEVLGESGDSAGSGRGEVHLAGAIIANLGGQAIAQPVQVHILTQCWSDHPGQCQKNRQAIQRGIAHQVQQNTAFRYSDQSRYKEARSDIVYPPL